MQARKKETCRTCIERSVAIIPSPRCQKAHARGISNEREPPSSTSTAEWKTQKIHQTVFHSATTAAAAGVCLECLTCHYDMHLMHLAKRFPGHARKRAEMQRRRGALQCAVKSVENLSALCTLDAFFRGFSPFFFLRVQELKSVPGEKYKSRGTGPKCAPWWLRLCTGSFDLSLLDRVWICTRVRLCWTTYAAITDTTRKYSVVALCALQFREFSNASTPPEG